MFQEMWETTRDLYEAGRLSEAERACRQLLDHSQQAFHQRSPFLRRHLHAQEVGWLLAFHALQQTPRPTSV